MKFVNSTVTDTNTKNSPTYNKRTNFPSNEENKSGENRLLLAVKVPVLKLTFLSHRNSYDEKLKPDRPSFVDFNSSF